MRRRLCVFCGSSQSATQAHLDLAKELGREMGKRKMELVYGAGRTGLMGALADAVLASGGSVYGVIPTFLKTTELAHDGLTELSEVSSMHERKAKMAQRADAFLALPGGFGTLDETFEILTWRQLELHEKPVLLWNSDGYYDDLLSFLRRAVSANLVRPQHHSLLGVVSSFDGLFSLLGLPDS